MDGGQGPEGGRASNNGLRTVTDLFLAKAPLPLLFQTLGTADGGLTSEEQVDIMKATTRHDTALKYPPPKNYRKAFVKKLLSLVEEKSGEVCEDLLEEYTALVSTPEDQDTDACGYSSYRIAEETVIVLKEHHFLVTEGTTGLRSWEAAKKLAEWASTSAGGRSLLDGKRVLELGAGTGFTGIAICSLCQPSAYLFTDGHPSVLQLLAQNVDMNEGCRGVGSVEELNWTSPEAAIGSLLRSFDPHVLIGADIVFDPQLNPFLAQVIRQFLELNATGIVLIGCCVRNESTLNQFKHILNNQFNLKVDTDSLSNQSMAYYSCSDLMMDTDHVLLKVTSA
jgi:predicted nicotinamide N-methyase